MKESTVRMSRNSNDQMKDLHEAACLGDLEQIMNLLNQGVPVDAVDQQGLTALQKAAEYQQIEVLRYLKKRGASLQRLDGQLHLFDAIVDESPNLKSGKGYLLAEKEKNYEQARICFARVAGTGSYMERAFAWACLGKIHLKYIYDLNKAINFLQKAVSQDYNMEAKVYASGLLGELYLSSAQKNIAEKGPSVIAAIRDDLQKARTHLEVAANQGYSSVVAKEASLHLPDAWTRSAECIIMCANLSYMDYQQAYSFLQQAEEKAGDEKLLKKIKSLKAEVCIILGSVCRQKNDMHAHYLKAFEYYNCINKCDDESAYFLAAVRLGEMYYNGLHVPLNCARAREYFEIAKKQIICSKAHALARIHLAVMHACGIELPKSTDEAMSLLEKVLTIKTLDNEVKTLASLRYCEIMHNLIEKINKDVDSVRMARILECENGTHGFAEARAILCILLGKMYYHGHGVLVDYARARFYFKEAAIQCEEVRERVIAQFYLGEIYYFGLGTGIDYAQACDYYKHLAEQNLCLYEKYAACVRLGECYLFGHGIEFDAKKARTLFEEAFKQSINTQAAILAKDYLDNDMKCKQSPRFPSNRLKENEG